MKRKILSGLVLATTFLVSASPVLAADISHPTTAGESTVTYTVGQKYTVVIPATVTLTDDNGIKGTATVNDAVEIKAANNALKIGNGKKLTVVITTGEDFKMTATGDTTGITYVVKKDTSGGDTINAAGLVAQATAGADADVKQTLYFESTAPKLAETYTGTLNFTINPAAT